MTFIASFAAAPFLQATVTGQWDFDDPSLGLTATIGEPLEYFDGPDGATHAATSFDTTTALGIPGIGGSPAQVMRFSTNLPTMGYVMRHGHFGENGGAGTM